MSLIPKDDGEKIELYGFLFGILAFALVVAGALYLVVKPVDAFPDRSGVTVEFCQGLEHYENEAMYQACPCLLNQTGHHWEAVRFAGYERRTCHVN